MSENKETLKSIFIKALENYKKKDFKNAEIFCYKILSIDPNHFDSLSLLATISAINGNYNNAKELLQKAIKIKPENINAIHNLGTAYKALGELKNAISFYKKVLVINPKHTNANYNLGVAFYELKELKTAKNYLQKTVEIQNNYAIAFASLANVHTDLKEFESAVSCYQKAIKIKPDLVGAHNNLGLVFRTLNDFENAINCYQKAIRIKPNHAGAHHNLAQVFKELGEFEKAIKSHQMAIKYEPENLTHYYFLSELKKDILNLPLKRKIAKIIANKTSTKRNLAYGNYLLATFERKNKNYEKELNYLLKGHLYYFEIKKEKFQTDVDEWLNVIPKVRKLINLSKFNNNITKINEKIKPIFIIGVPRCGSTLVEKVIASGDKYVPAGEETGIFHDVVVDTINKNRSLISDINIIQTMILERYNQKGLIKEKNDYIFTDKSLENLFYMGLVKEIFPNAKVIYCKRNTFSCIMSIIKNNLTDTPWAHSQKNIFEYFDIYFNEVENLKKIFPNFIYELEYEKFVNDPEIESKKLLKFCNLPWNKRCLEFYKRKDLISKTASHVQIREAIYQNSINRYSHYKKFFKNYENKYFWFN